MPEPSLPKEASPRNFTDAEAEAFLRYLTDTKKRKKTLVEAFLETNYGKLMFNLYKIWLSKEKRGGGESKRE